MGSGQKRDRVRSILPVAGLLTVVLAVSGAGAGGKHETSAGQSPPATGVELAGVNVITGSSSASMPVHLSQPATFDFFKVAFEGAGRIFGFLLHRDGDPSGATAFAVHANYCLVPGCANVDFGGGDEFGLIALPGRGFEFEGTLPAGDYHLYLIADGKPVRVTVPLEGLGGLAVELAPAGPSSQVLTTPQPDFPLVPPVGATLYSAGSTRVVGKFGGWYIGSLWVDERLPHEVNLPASCVFPGRPGRTRFQFPCLRGGEISIFPSGSRPVGHPRGPLGLLGKNRAILQFSWQTAPGVFSVGAYNNVLGPAIEGHLQIVWVDFLA